MLEVPTLALYTTTLEFNIYISLKVKSVVVFCCKSWHNHNEMVYSRPSVPAASRGASSQHTTPLSHLTCPRRTTKNIQNFLKMKNFTKHWIWYYIRRSKWYIYIASEHRRRVEGENDKWKLANKPSQMMLDMHIVTAFPVNSEPNKRGGTPDYTC